MKKIIFNNGDTLEAERIVKTSDSIVGFNGNTEVFSFRGISDFSLFTLEKGQKWDIDGKEQLESTVADLSFDLMVKNLEIQQVQTDQASLIYQLMVKGVL